MVWLLDCYQGDTRQKPCFFFKHADYAKIFGGLKSLTGTTPSWSTNDIVGRIVMISTTAPYRHVKAKGFWWRNYVHLWVLVASDQTLVTRFPSILNIILMEYIVLCFIHEFGISHLCQPPHTWNTFQFDVASSLTNLHHAQDNRQLPSYIARLWRHNASRHLGWNVAVGLQYSKGNPH